MVIRLEEPERSDLRIIPVSLSLDGVVTLSDAFIFVIDNPIPMLLTASTGFLLFRSQKIGFSGLRVLLMIPFIPVSRDAAAGPILAICCNFLAIT